MSIEGTTLEIIRKKPEVKAILERALEFEDSMKPDDLGFEWFEVGAPATLLNRLCVDPQRILKITLKTRSSTHYRLLDVEATRRALEFLREEVKIEAEKPFAIPYDLFSVIEGYGGVKEVVKAGLNSPKPCHFLLVGSVSTAKSLFLEEVNRVKGSSYHLGSSSTKAGLSEFLFDARPRILLIDELDKMSREDYAVLLSLMESGKVAETKYHRRREEHMDVWVFATANTLKGIPPENVSRFKPYIFRFREYTPEEYVKVVVRVLEREGVNPDLARYIASKLAGFTRDVRAARGLGRVCKTEGEVDRHMEILEKYKGFKRK